MATSSIPWKQFGKLHDNRTLEEYFHDREYKHGDYCHYTKLSVIDSILSHREFWLNSVTDFNDENDAKQFTDPKSRFYSLCFSTGVNENLSLWYLYSGIDGQGGRLRLTKAFVNKLIERDSKYSLYEVKKDVFGRKEKVRKVMDLIKNENMILTFRDILYYKIKNNEMVDLKYNTMTNYNFSSREFSHYLSQHSGFCKGLIWYYEKETRLLVELTGSALSQLEEDKSYIVTLQFNDKIYHQLKLDLAPEIKEISDITDKYSGIQKFLFDTSHVGLSAYSGTLKMNLCTECDTRCDEKCDKRKIGGATE